MPKFLPEFPLSELTPADYNPRRIKPDAFGTLRESLQRLGVVKPIILNADGTIVAGHQRTKAMTAIGMTTTPAVMLDGKVRRQDEIRFNMMHNSIETSTAGATWEHHDGGVGYVERPASEFWTAKGVNASAVVGISQLVTKYGAWGSIVVAEDGEVLANTDYLYACKLVGAPVLAYRLPNADRVDFARFMGVDYGEYFFEPLDVQGWAQTHAQPHRLRAAKNELGELEDRTHANVSRVYQSLVLPHLASRDDHPRMIDFGAGREDHARDLAARGHDILAYEPHFRKEGSDAFDVRHIVGEVRDLGRSVAQHGLFDVVVLDSVLNSVINDEYMDWVLTSVNVLCAADGVLFTNTRDLANARQRMSTKRAAPGKPRIIEFFDEKNYTATYTAGKWTIQKFHDRAEFGRLLEEYFEDVTVKKLSSGYIHATCRRPRALDPARYRKALEEELNMPLPGDFRHGRQSAAVQEICAAAEERDLRTVERAAAGARTVR